MSTFANGLGLARLGTRLASAAASQGKFAVTSAGLHTTGTSRDGKILCTMIPGDGVGPELMDSVEAAVKAIGAPIEFEKFQLSEVHKILFSSSDKNILI